MKLYRFFKAFQVLFITLAVGLLIHPGAFAAVLDVSAEIPTNSPELNVTILKYTDGNPDDDPWSNSQVIDSGVMDFGMLTYQLADNSNAGLFYSPVGYCVVLFAESFGKPYDLLSSCDGIRNSAGANLNQGFGLTPVYSPLDAWKVVGGPPNGVAQGNPGPGAGPGEASSGVGNHIIYTSEPGVGTARIVQAYYGFPPYAAGGGDPFPGYIPIPLTQAPGKYEGQVTVTISLK